MLKNVQFNTHTFCFVNQSIQKCLIQIRERNSLPQVRVLKVDIPTAATEAGIRTVAAVSASRAFSLLEQSLLAKGITPSVDQTLRLLFKQLADSGEAESCLKLLAYTEQSILDHPSRDKFVPSPWPVFAFQPMYRILDHPEI